MKTPIDANNFEFQLKLRDEFSRRCRSNSRYSVRAFARHLDLDSSTLSQIFAGKRRLSAKTMNSICGKIGIKLSAQRPQDADFNLLQADMFSVISDWYHFAILDLTAIKGFKADAAWIGRKLSISEIQARHALERLLRLEMLKKENGKIIKSQGFYTNYSEGMTSAAHKEYQRQVIQKALEAVDNCPQEAKDITSITIAVNSKRLKEAKEKLKNFRRELCGFLEDGNADSVYHLALQLYPVTKFDN